MNPATNLLIGFTYSSEGLAICWIVPSFMNELAKIFNAMGIDTNDVIEAASTKWNFIKLKPGLVGGHCISVDPYYLIQKAQVYGVLPRIMVVHWSFVNSDI